jgi:hypothetical protein
MMPEIWTRSSPRLSVSSFSPRTSIVPVGIDGGDRHADFARQGVRLRCIALALELLSAAHSNVAGMLNSDSGPVAGGVRLTLPSRCVLGGIALRRSGAFDKLDGDDVADRARTTARGQRHISGPERSSHCSAAAPERPEPGGERLGRQLVLRERRGRASAMASRISLERLRSIFHHLVGGGDHLRIDFIGALRLDHVDEFLDDIDVRSLEHSDFAQAAATFLSRRRRLAARPMPAVSTSILPPIACRPAGVGKAGDFDPAEFGLRAVGAGRRHGAIGTDR